MARSSPSATALGDSATAISNIIHTVAGGGLQIPANGLQATQVVLDTEGIAIGPDGSLYIADYDRARVFRVDEDGIITIVAGTGVAGYNGDGIPATQAMLDGPWALAVAPDGTLYISERGTNGSRGRIRRVGRDGLITTVAGTGTSGYSGDGGPATQAQISPGPIALGPDGSLYISDYSHRIRRVGPDGIITTVAGTGQSGSDGDGGPATRAKILGGPNGIAMGPDGSLYLTEREAYRVRRVGPDGIITTIAGTGQAFGSLGDGGPATQALLREPNQIALGTDGSVYISEDGNNPYHRVRRVTPDGIITTFAGTGNGGFSGDGGPATAAQVLSPDSLAVAPDGGIYIVDSRLSRVRLVEKSLPSFTDTDLAVASEDGSQLYRFDASGRHLQTLNALTRAPVYTFGYDHAGHLTTVTDGDGNITTIERDAAGNPTAIVAPFGQRTTLTLDANGYLASITNPAGEATRFTSSASGLLETETEPAGGVHTFSYDTQGLLTRDENPDGGFSVLARTELANGYEVTLTSAENVVTTHRVERLPTDGKRLTMTSSDGFQTVSVIGTDGSTTITYPDGTILSEIEGPDPRWGMQAPIVKQMTITTPGGLTSSWTDTRTATLTDPADLQSLTTLTDTVTINGRTYTSTYDAAARRFTDTTPEGRQTVTTVDAQGRALSGQSGDLAPFAATYDPRGRLTSLVIGTGPQARTFTLTYDAQGFVSTFTDPLSATDQLTYDAVGQVTSTTLPDGQEILFNYDADGNLTSLTPPGQPAHTFSYTAGDLVDSYTPPTVGAAATTTYTYNLDGGPTQIQQPDGSTTTVGYDAAGRTSTLTLPAGQIRYTYDPLTGNLVTVTAPDGGTLSYSYEGGLLTGSTATGTVQGTVGYTYNSNYQLASESVPSGSTVAFQYDRDGLLTQAGSLTVSRSAQDGLITGTALGNLLTAVTYDTFGELETETATFNGTGLLSTEYTRDALGRITQKTETVDGVTDTTAYTYDATGRLTEVRQNGVLSASYVYDANGNRLSRTDAGGTTTGTYDAQDRMTQYGTAAYTYSANGELASKTVGGQITAYQYDPLGNLTRVDLPGGTRIDYVVDGQNRRIGKKVNGTLVQGFLYRDDLRPVAELDGNNNVVSRFVYGTNQSVPDYMVRGGQTYRLLTDHLGSVRLVVDTATGAVVQRLDYDEFGNVLLDTNPGFQPFGFAGGLYDRDTGLVRFGARDYDGRAGRWTAKDPILFAAGDTNLFGYVGNDPLGQIDPSGLYFTRRVARHCRRPGS